MRTILILAALTGCADDSAPQPELVDCAAFGGALAATDGVCRVHVADFTSFARIHNATPMQLGADELMRSTSDLGLDYYGAQPTTWTGDPAVGAAIYVDQFDVSVNAEALTCTWVACEGR